MNIQQMSKQKKVIHQHKLAAFISEHDHQLTISYQNSDPSQTTLVKQLIQGAVAKQSLKGLTKLTKIQGQIISSDPAMAAILSKKKAINNSKISNCKQISIREQRFNFF